MNTALTLSAILSLILALSTSGDVSKRAPNQLQLEQQKLEAALRELQQEQK